MLFKKLTVQEADNVWLLFLPHTFKLVFYFFKPKYIDLKFGVGGGGDKLCTAAWLVADRIESFIRICCLLILLLSSICNTNVSNVAIQFCMSSVI